jgi:hypothetical protein
VTKERAYITRERVKLNEQGAVKPKAGRERQRIDAVDMNQASAADAAAAPPLMRAVSSRSFCVVQFR